MSVNIQSIEVAPQPPPFSAPVPLSSDSSHFHSGMLEDTTLDEPVLDTVKRDLGMVWTKLRKVMIPSGDTRDELRNWDLWGPLFLCLILAILLSIDESGNIQENNNRDRPAVVFSVMLLVVWVGAVVVTVNAKLLGGNVSFFQNICLLGYCVAPMILATALCMIVRISIPDQFYYCTEVKALNLQNMTDPRTIRCDGWSDTTTCPTGRMCDVTKTGFVNVILRLLFVIGGMFWSLRSSLGFLSEVVVPQRRALAAYPVLLFFTAISWMTMLRTSSA